MTLLFLFAGGGASGAQSLTLPFLGDGNVLYAPSVAPGAVTLSLPFLSDGDTLYAPIIWQETAEADAQIIFRRRRRWMSR